MDRLTGFFALLLSAFLMAPQVLPPPREPQPNGPIELFVPPTPLPTAEPPAAREEPGAVQSPAPSVPAAEPLPTPTAAAARVPLVIPTEAPPSPPPGPRAG